MSALAKIGLFAAGTLFGSAGFKALASDNAKTAYTHVTAAALRAKDSIIEETSVLKENCDDILSDAKQLNEDRAAKAEAKAAEPVYEDLSAAKKPAAKKPAAKKAPAKKTTKK